MKKRILSILLTLCMALMLCPATAFADDPAGTQKGDLNLDGLVTTVDAILLQNCLEDLESFENLSEDGYVAADFNGDGVVNYSDLTELQSHLELPESSITVTNGKASACGNEIGKAASHTRVTLTADSPSDNMVFDKWIVNEGGVTIADASGATTTFTMPENPVSVTATYKLLSADEKNSLAVTVEGFVVGKTPNDCTYTFDSTIPGVTFSEDDIQYIRWDKYAADGDLYSFSNTDAFSAGTRYRLVINLENNGLTEVPAVTVNGNTPYYCTLPFFGGVAETLNIGCDLGTPAEPTVTINGADEVCAKQDYKFTVTASEGITLKEDCTYYIGGGKVGSVSLTTIDGVTYGELSHDLYDADDGTFELYADSDEGIEGYKLVRISRDHIYENGVCGCGAVKQYTVEYIGSGYDPICVDFKTHGEALTLRGETFTKDGFVQTGWLDKETGAFYALGDLYNENADATMNPYFEKTITMTVSFTTTVELGDAGEPGETTFDLAVIGDSAPDADKSNVTITGSVTTDGAGDYTGTLTFTGPEGTLWHMLSEGAFVQQVDDGKSGWTVDDTVWGLLMSQAELSEDAATGYSVYVVPTSVDEFGNYDIDWDSIDWDNLQPEEMRFTNTYTAHAYVLNHDADGHWDECACDDKRNEEPHRYGDWKVTKEATETEEGRQERICTVCDYKQTETIPVQTHTHDYTRKHDETGHWDECACGDKQNEEPHKYGDWTVTKKATETAMGEKEHTCTVCGYTEKAEIAKLTAVDTTDSTKDNPDTGATTSPQTGENSHMPLWIALLFVSGAGVIGTTVYGRKKRAR